MLSPGLGAPAYPPAGRAMLAAYAQQFGPAAPEAVFGYAAMTLMLDAIRRATDNGRKPARRSKVVASLLARVTHQSVLGQYRLDANGDTSIRTYGIYRLVNGRMVFSRSATG